MPPPRDCPICKARVWSREETPNIYRGWDGYNDHLRRDHQEYQRWNTLVFNFYSLPLLLFFAGLVGLGLAQYAQGISLSPQAGLVLLLFWSAALVVFVAILIVQQRGKTRFRQTWDREHLSNASKSR